jgi:hypothetical protein
MQRLTVVLVVVTAAIVTPAGTTLARGPAPDPGAVATPASVAAQSIQADFDGDGLEDVAVGAPGEGVGPVDGAGAVTVLYGAAGGLRGLGSQLFHQDVAGIGSTAEEFDQFGYAVATPLPQGSGVAASGSSSSTTTARPAPGQ